MKVAIHQPEHFPYMGFFQKMSEADLFVILDSVKFRKNYFQNRNKFLNNSGDDEWFTVPVEKSASSKLIKDVAVVESANWRRKINTKIRQNLKVDVSSIYEPGSLSEINMRSIRWCMAKLNISVPLILSSNLQVSGQKSELLASIMKELGGNHYISGPSGKDYLDMSYFNGIEVSFFEPSVPNYYSMLYNITKGAAL
jgi:hypothetical protein